MNVFVDQNLPPVLATTIDGFIRHDGGRAFHISECPGLPTGKRSTDVEWISFLRMAPGLWIFLTADMRPSKNRVKRSALRAAGRHRFVLAPGFQTMPLHQRDSILIWKWPDIVKIVDLTMPRTTFQISVGRSGKLQSLSI